MQLNNKILRFLLKGINYIILYGFKFNPQKIIDKKIPVYDHSKFLGLFRRRHLSAVYAIRIEYANAKASIAGEFMAHAHEHFYGRISDIIVFTLSGFVRSPKFSYHSGYSVAYIN